MPYIFILSLCYILSQSSSFFNGCICLVLWYFTGYGAGGVLPGGGRLICLSTLPKPTQLGASVVCENRAHDVTCYTAAEFSVCITGVHQTVIEAY